MRLSSGVSLYSTHIFKKLLNMSCPTKSATGKHSATLIFLHGLGDTGHGWLQALHEMRIPHLKVMCPNAPVQKVTLNFGMQMPSWFDIKTLSFDAEEDEAGIIKSSEDLKKIIEDEEKNGIPSNRIVIGGFSQGGAVALHTFMSTEKILAGYIGLSTFLPMHQKVKEICKNENRKTKLFMGHGKADPVVKHIFGESSRDVLKQYYDNLTFKSYNDMGHTSCQQEMKDVQEFLKSIIPK